MSELAHIIKENYSHSRAGGEPMLKGLRLGQGGGDVSL